MYIIHNENVRKFFKKDSVRYSLTVLSAIVCYGLIAYVSETHGLYTLHDFLKDDDTQQIEPRIFKCNNNIFEGTRTIFSPYEKWMGMIGKIIEPQKQKSVEEIQEIRDRYQASQKRISEDNDNERELQSFYKQCERDFIEETIKRRDNKLELRRLELENKKLWRKRFQQLV